MHTLVVLVYKCSILIFFIAICAETSTSIFLTFFCSFNGNNGLKKRAWVLCLVDVLLLFFNWNSFAILFHSMFDANSFIPHNCSLYPWNFHFQMMNREKTKLKKFWTNEKSLIKWQQEQMLEISNKPLFYPVFFLFISMEVTFEFVRGDVTSR